MPLKVSLDAHTLLWQISAGDQYEMLPPGCKGFCTSDRFLRIAAKGWPMLAARKQLPKAYMILKLIIQAFSSMRNLPMTILESSQCCSSRSKSTACKFVSGTLSAGPGLYNDVPWSPRSTPTVIIKLLHWIACTICAFGHFHLCISLDSSSSAGPPQFLFKIQIYRHSENVE